LNQNQACLPMAVESFMTPRGGGSTLSNVMKKQNGASVLISGAAGNVPRYPLIDIPFSQLGEIPEHEDGAGWRRAVPAPN
jgi:hypothetical protein